MELILISCLILICIFGFAENEHNMKTLGKMIEDLERKVDNLDN